LDVDTVLLVAVWAIAAAVTIGATVVALRATRRARRAAALVAQLLEPVVLVDDPDRGDFPTPDDGVAPLGSLEPDVPPAPITEAAVFAAAPAESTRPAPDAVAHPDTPTGSDRDPGLTRIPVFDLERLRWWLTDGEVALGRIAVVSVELDDLAQLNQRLGYKAGAQLLEAITTRLRAVTRPRDVVAHVNPERFVLVCRDVPDRAAAQALAERISMGVAHPSLVVDGFAEVTASIGVALSFAAHERPENVLGRALTAGNLARERGGACIVISEEKPSPTVTDDEFTRALARGELLLHYLPIVSCATGRVAGLESLIRWDHPDRGLLLPSEFLPDAERTGAIVDIGTWALEQACLQMAQWHRGAGESLKLDVNVSAREFAEPAFPTQVQRIVAESGLAPGAVWLEVTEETLAANRDASGHALRQLHELGVRLVVDDFGTGASSLVSLKQFPFDAIKIDRAFVADLGADREGNAICSAIIELAHSLRLCTIAEGVETLEQYAALRALGCELGQGHLFGPARPAADYGAIPAATLGVEHAPEAG
jgi:diguanylate cyclase (GGDEF)-like protein